MHGTLDTGLAAPFHRFQVPATRAALALLTWLAACGGGGGGGSSPDPDPPVQPPGATVAGVQVSARSPVADGCTGGRTDDTVYAHAEVEPWLAVSPRDGATLVGAWQQDRSSAGGARALVSARSSDGGRSWRTTLHPMSRCGVAAVGSAGDMERVTDPWVDIAPDGTLHLMGLGLIGNSFAPGSSNAMLAQRSTDGGATWSEPVTLQRDGPAFFNDKNTLTADPTDARYVYAVWDRLDASGVGPTLLARSTDGGARWEPARTIHAPQVAGGVAQTIGNRIVVLTGGAERGLLVNVFMQIDTVGSTATSRVRVQRSADRGLTWSDAITVAEARPVGTSDPETGAPVRDGAVVPAIATGPAGELWVAWQDARFSGGRRDAIALARSDDGGRTWSTPLAVNRDAGVGAFTPALAVRPDGRVAVLHFDLRSNTADASTLLADLWLLTSADGRTWSESALARGFDLNRAVPARGGRFLGDYHGLVPTPDGWIALVALPGGGGDGPSNVHAIAAPAAASASASRHVGRDRPSASASALMSATFSAAHQATLRRALAARTAAGRDDAR